MNYYQPRQIDPKADRPDAGKWRYTCMNDGAVWPVGNCPTCEGHDTKAEAYEHQYEWELDNARFIAGEIPPEAALSRQRCQAKEVVRVATSMENVDEREMDCALLTTSYARVGLGIGTHIFLCIEHLNREGLANAWDGPGDVISS